MLSVNSKLLDAIDNDNIKIMEHLDKSCYIKEREVIELFNSLFNNYPIGSFVFYKEDNDLYIIDGYMRLMMLYCALFGQTKPDFDKINKDKIINHVLYFDLENKFFFFDLFGDFPKEIQPHQIPVHILLKTANFRSYFRRRIDPYVDGETAKRYFDIADKYSRQLHDYKVLVTIVTDATQNDIDKMVKVLNKNAGYSI